MHFLQNTAAKRKRIQSSIKGFLSNSNGTSAGAAASANVQDISADHPSKRLRNHSAEDKGRTVRTEWYKGREAWLREIEVDGEMKPFCNWCSSVPQADGKKKLYDFKAKLHDIKQHETSDMHKQSEQKYKKMCVELDSAPEYLNTAKAELAKRLNELVALEAVAEDGGERNIADVLKEVSQTAQLNEFNRKRIQFKLVFHNLKHHRPMLDYERMQDLLATEPGIKQLMPRKHMTDDAGWEMAEAIDRVLIKRMRYLLKEATAFSLTIDASAAVNRTDYLNVEARLFHGNDLHLVFICMKKLGLQTSAQQQLNVLLTALADFAEVSLKDLQKKLVAVAADGCAAMQGHRGGLLTLLQKKCPHMLAINCTAHKVNLAAEICDKDVPFHRISSAIRELATYINASPLRTERLEQLQVELKLEQIKPVTVNDTRWMPLYGALKNMLKFLPAALALLRQDRDKVTHARTLLHELTCAPVLFGLHAIMPLLSSLEHLTKVVQSQHLYPGDVAEAVKACKRNITKQYLEKDNQQIKFREVYELCKFGSDRLLTNNRDGKIFLQTHDATTSEDGETITTTVRPTTTSLKEVPVCERVPTHELPGIQVKRCAADAIKSAANVAKLVLEELERRLPSTELMEALCLLTPRYWIDLCIRCKKGTREEDTPALFTEPLKLLEVLIKQFGGTKQIINEGGGARHAPERDFVEAMVDAVELRRQYGNFQQFMLDRSMELWERLLKKNGQKETEQQVSESDLMKHAGGEAVVEFWNTRGLNLEYLLEFLKLRDIVLSVPFGSVENERRFSAMNLTLTFLRNALGDEHFNAAMRVRATPFTVKNFEFWDAFIEWFAMCKRRGTSM